MTQIEKVRLLKLLYQYRAMGFEYFKEYKSVGSNSDAILPKDLNTLNKAANSCYLCNLSKIRKNVVFGEGNESADLMFIGESPKNFEDESGRVFVGLAGDIVTNIIEKVLGLKREDVYITNIIKCITPANRVPSMEEVSTCKPYLLQQIELIKPKVIVALGSTSFHHLTGEYDMPIENVRGEVISLGEIKLVPTLCPYFLQRNPSSKKEVLQDMLKVKSLL